MLEQWDDATRIQTVIIMRIAIPMALSVLSWPTIVELHNVTIIKQTDAPVFKGSQLHF